MRNRLIGRVVRAIEIEPVGMAMPGALLPDRIRRMLSGIQTPRISRPRVAFAIAVCAVASAILAVGTLVHAQSQAAARPKFEAVSIKPNKSGDLRTSAVPSPERGSYIAENQAVKQLIRQAYGLRSPQLEGGPKWIDDTSADRFDIVAKAAGPVSKGQLMLMLQVMLEDRFRLKFHRETRQLPVYALVVAKKGVLGPNLQPPSPGDSPGSPVSGPPNHLKGRNATMQDLASYLSGVDGRQVLDRTGLAGRYDFTLESLPGPDNPLSNLKGLKLAPPPENGVSLFTALKEQLGLELDSAKGPVEIMVIDHVEKPSEN